MGNINVGRVIVGGLVAGLVVNVGEFILNMVVMGPELDTAMTAMNLPPIGGQAISVFVILGFVLGLAAVWLYAAARPRLGPGVVSAGKIGVVVWLLAYFYQGVAMTVMGMYPTSMMAVGLVWGLVEVVLATIAGAWVYTEPAPARM